MIKPRSTVPERMRAVVVTEFGSRAELREVPVPTAPAHGVLVKVEVTGLCRSDVGGWLGHDDGITLPHVPGHEFVGTVVATGDEVNDFAVGQRITVPFVCACGDCPDCAAGDGQVCRNQTQPGFTHWGSYADYVVVDHADVNLIAVDDAVDSAAAALLGCRFATAYRGIIHQAQCTGRDRVLVVGCGGVGLSAIMIARSVGAEVVAVDVNADALARAETLGARWTVSSRDKSVADTVSEIDRLVPESVTVSVDALGHESTLSIAVRSLGRRGRHVQIGLLSEPPRVPMGEIIARELALYGSHGMSAQDYPALMAAVRSGELRPHEIVTSRIRLDEVPDALQAVASGTWPGGVTVVDLQ